MLFKNKSVDKIVLLAACWLLMTGCHCSFKGDYHMITEDQAIEIAKKEFEKHGRVAADHVITIKTYYDDDNQWIVWFDKKGPFPVPGGKSAVLVDKTTGQTIFRPGQ